MFIFLVHNVPADGVAQLGVKASAGYDDNIWVLSSNP